MFKRLSNLLSGEGYQARAIRSTGMTLLSFGGDNLLRLASNLILTRILFPEAFGLMALVQVAVTGANLFSDFGLRGAVVQDPRGNDPAFLNTAFTLQIARGLVLMTAIMLFAAPLAAFYEVPLLAELLLVSAFIPLIHGFYSTRMLTANRFLTLERVTFLTLGGHVAGAAVTILLAAWLQSVWALAIGNLVSPLAIAVLSHVVLPGNRDRIGIDRAALGALVRYSGFIFIASMAGFLVNHGDKAVLGKFVSLEDLAIFNIATLFAVLPQRISFAVSSRVIFPLYARRPPAESPKNRRKINKARWLVTTPLVAVAAVLAIIGDPMVRLLYDPRYEAAGPLLSLVALAAMPQLILQSYFRAPLASGHSGRYTVFQVGSGGLYMGLLVLLVPLYGLVGAVAAGLLNTLVLYPLMLVIIRPYKVWDPLHDAVFFTATLAIAAGVIWLNGATITPVVAPILAPILASF